VVMVMVAMRHVDKHVGHGQGTDDGDGVHGSFAPRLCGFCGDVGGLC
jgi:hypothetical protein